MAFKMKNPSVAKMVKMAGNNRAAMKMKAEEAAAMKMKKAAMKLKEEAAMKLKKEAAMKLKKESAMKAAKPDFPDIDGDGNTSESMKEAAADKKSGMKMKKSPAKMGHSPKKMKKSAMKLSEADKKKAMANAMPDAEVSTISKETMAEAKKLGLMSKGESGGSYFDTRKARKAISDIGDWRTDKESVAKKQNIRRLVKAFS